MRRLVVLFGLLVPLAAHASPNVALDDPRYDELATYLANRLLFVAAISPHPRPTAPIDASAATSRG